MPRAQRQYRPQKRPRKQYQAKKDNWYCDRTWRKVRQRFLARHPLCADPLGRHAVSHEPRPPATEVHHVLGRRAHPETTYDPRYLEALCSSCHGAITIRDHPPRGRRAGDPDPQKRARKRPLQETSGEDSIPPPPSKEVVNGEGEPGLSSTCSPSATPLDELVADAMPGTLTLHSQHGALVLTCLYASTGAR